MAHTHWLFSETEQTTVNAQDGCARPVFLNHRFRNTGGVLFWRDFKNTYIHKEDERRREKYWAFIFLNTHFSQIVSAIYLPDIIESVLVFLFVWNKCECSGSRLCNKDKDVGPETPAVEKHCAEVYTEGLYSELRTGSWGYSVHRPN